MKNCLFVIHFLIPILGIIGTVILAISVNPIINALSGMVISLSKIIQMNVEYPDHQSIMKGVNQHLKKYGKKPTMILVYIGLSFLGISYILQIFLLFIK